MHLHAFLLEKYSKDKKADNIIQFWQLGRKKHSKKCFFIATGNNTGGPLDSSLHYATQGDAGVF